MCSHRTEMLLESTFRDLRPGHFVQTLEPVELIEIGQVEEHERTMTTIAKNIGPVT
jgi:hypothetical protein